MKVHPFGDGELICWHVVSRDIARVGLQCTSCNVRMREIKRPFFSLIFFSGYMQGKKYLGSGKISSLNSIVELEFI